jgi:hypothetical protein
MNMKNGRIGRSRSICAAATVGLSAMLIGGAARASTYSNMSPYLPVTGDQSASGTGGIIFDDVPIPAAVNPGGGAITINSLTFGILRDPGAPALTLTAYAATPQPGSTSPFHGQLAGFPWINSTVSNLGTISVGSYNGASAVVPVTLNLATPIAVTPNTVDQVGYYEIAIGLKFSSTASQNSWAVAVPSATDANWDGAWDFNGTNGAAYALSDPTGPIYTTFALTVNTTLPSQWKNNADGTWSPYGNWIGGVPGYLSDVAKFGSVITAPRTVTVDGARTLGSLIFDNANKYTLSGSTITIDTTTGSGSINVVNGSHTIATPLNINKPTNINVTPSNATLTISGDITAAAGATLTKLGAGTAEVKNVRADGLTISAGAVRITSNGSSTGTSNVKSLSVTGSGALDLTNNSMVVEYGGSSPRAAIEGLIKNGFALGAWTGAGITSSAAAAATQTDHRTALGIVESSDINTGTFSSFRGQTVDLTSVLVRYTAAGDANIDGTVDLTDFTLLASNFNGTSKRWYNGDFDYNGTVDLTDFTILASNFNYTLPSDAAAPLGSVVPEPHALALVAAASLLVKRRRR